MVFNNGLEERKSNVSIEASDKKCITSKTSVKIQKSTQEFIDSKKPKTWIQIPDVPKFKNNLKINLKSVEKNYLIENNKSQVATLDSTRNTNKRLSEIRNEDKSEMSLKKKIRETNNENQKIIEVTLSINNDNLCPKVEKNEVRNSKGQKESTQKKILSASIITHENGNGKSVKPRTEIDNKKPSEIPKLKPFWKPNSENPLRANIGTSKLPVKTTGKEAEIKMIQSSVKLEESATKLGESLSKAFEPDKKLLQSFKTKPKSLKTAMKTFQVKKETKLEEKVKEAAKDDFTFLVPLYENELKKITDVWVNTIYCSLTMRTNLVKLLFQVFPHINKSQFQTEDEKLLQCIAQAKNYTKSETDSLIQFLRSLMTNREKAKEQYSIIMSNKQFAEVHNYDWRKIIRKISEVGEEAKHLQIQTSELQKKKEALDKTQKEKVRNMEDNLANKEKELEKLVDQLNILKQKESTYKGNVLMKVKDYKEIKADVLSLKSMKTEFEELKSKFLYQNEIYHKKIKDLEVLLEKKKKNLEKEKQGKQQLQTFLKQLQVQQKRLTMSIGKNQVDYVMGKELVSKDKRRKQLWMAAIKLVLKGFLIQMKRLERDKNKMLLELQSNNSKNLSATAISIIKKDNFIKSIKTQMNDFYKACKCSEIEKC